MERFPAFIASEVSSRLLAELPTLRDLFNAERLELSGEEIERLAISLFLLGYSQGLSDAADRTSALLDWAASQGATT